MFNFSIFRQIVLSTKCSNNLRSFSKIYEPDYLEALKPKYPCYPSLTVKVRGYDFPLLEKYQGYIHKIAELMDFDVEDSYAMPARETKVIKFKPKTTVTESEYILKLYARHVKISNVTSIGLPIFIRMIEKDLPIGVQLDIEEFSEEGENYRFVPDKQLLDLKQELETMKAKREK